MRDAIVDGRFRHGALTESIVRVDSECRGWKTRVERTNAIVESPEILGDRRRRPGHPASESRGRASSRGGGSVNGRGDWI